MTEAVGPFVADYLRTNDSERYFSTLLIDERHRGAVQALYAFNADVASVRDRVTSPAPGEIRLQWWDDALSGTNHGNVRQNPVADALFSTIREYGLPVVPLQRLIAARRFDLYDDPMPDLNTFEGYAGETASVLYQFAAMILNNGVPVEQGDAAGHLGVAQALIGHLTVFGRNAALGRLFLPLDVIKANGVTEGEIFSGTVSEGLLAAQQQFCEMALDHLGKAETAIAALAKPLRPAFAALPILRAALAQIEAANERPYEQPRQLADWQKIARMTWWAWRNR